MKSIPPEELESIEERLFESLAGDEPPKRAHRAVAVALGLSATLTTATITGATAGAAAASASGAGATGAGVSGMAAKAGLAAKASTMLLVKWVGVGTLAGAVSVGAVRYARQSWQGAKPAATLSAGAPRAPIGAPRGLGAERQAPVAEPQALIAEPRAPIAGLPATVAEAQAPRAEAPAVIGETPAPRIEPQPRMAERAAPSGARASGARTEAFAPAPASRGSAGKEPIAKEPTAKEAAREPLDEPSNLRARPASTLAAEVAALDDVRRAIVARDGERALGLLRRHARDFPSATLNIEATVLRIEALLLAGSTQAARDLGRDFLASYPTSTHATRVRHLLADY